MASQQVNLFPVDVADVTILVDNFLDILLPSDEVTHRAPMYYDWSAREQLIAEHGYSLLLTVVREGRSESILYDAGLGRRTVLHNMDVLEEKATDLRAVILSHGHADHHGGLEGMVLVTGQVDRVTDTRVWDDQAVVCNVKDKGLVVLSACSHAGAINVLKHAQRLTGIHKVRAFIGGFHLSGGIFEQIIPRTVAELITIGPSWIFQYPQFISRPASIRMQPGR